MDQVSRFLIKYRPESEEFHKFAKRQKSLSAIWQGCGRSDWMLWMLGCLEFKPARELRLFSCYCARQFWEMLSDERSKKAVETAERFARGLVTGRELEVAREMAYGALSDAQLRSDRIAEALAWAAVSTTKEDAFTAANDAASYAAAVANKTKRGDYLQIREAQANRLRDLMPNPFAFIT